MKAIARIIALSILLLTACAPVQSNSPTPATAITTHPTLTSTAIPPTFTASPTLTPSPTLEFPIGLNTALPELTGQITAATIAYLKEVARYYGNSPYIARLTKDQTRLFVRDQVGIDVYDFQTKKLQMHVDLSPAREYRFGLQISNDGKWALIDGQWLLHPSAASVEERLQDIFSRKELSSRLNGKNIALSPDGKRLAVHEYRCYDACIESFHFLNLESGEFTAAPSMGGFYPAFSPDSSLIAMQVGNQIIVWNVEDGTRVNEFPLDRSPMGVSFSEDSSLIAIRHGFGNVDIWNVKQGQKMGSIEVYDSECYGDASIPLFIKNQKIATFDCKGTVQVWSLGGTPLSKNSYPVNTPSVFFDEKGEINLLAPPHSVGPWDRFEAYLLNDFLFIDNQKIEFQYYASAARTYRGCVLDLRGDDQSCKDDLILGTDNQYYKFVKKKNTIQLFPSSVSISSKPLYEVKWSGLDVVINKFDPEHALLLYTTYPTQYTGEGKLIDLGTGKIIKKWELRDPRNISFSDDNQVAALCLDLTGFGVNYFSNKGKLSLIDLNQKTIIYEEPITCSNAALSHAPENRQLAITYEMIPPGTDYLRSLIMTMNFNTQDGRQKIDAGCERTIDALVYSPDDSLLVVSCREGGIHFLNPVDGTEVGYLEGYPAASGLAFSPDGKMLAVSFGGGTISVLSVPPTIQ